MGLKKGIEILKSVVDRQLEFITWLKTKNLYDVNESAANMQKLYAVWEGVHSDYTNH
jgi:hypothetical protein